MMENVDRVPDFDVDEEDAVKVVGREEGEARGYGDPVFTNDEPGNAIDALADLGELSDKQVDELSAAQLEQMREQIESRESRESPRPTIVAFSQPANRELARRQAIIDEAYQLAVDALETFRQAVGVRGIVDIAAHTKYGTVLKALGSAVDDFERMM